MTDGPVMIVCGGRDFEPDPHHETILRSLIDIWLPRFFFHGDARGCDRWAAAIAKDHLRNTPDVVEAFPADWNLHGPKASGPIRNKRMADEAQERTGWTTAYDGGEPAVVVVAFPGGTGTAGMVRIARDRRFRVIDLGRLG